ncbi:MAG: nickel transporter [Actinomycetota bacterium]|nr:nickel transporter [Actinomycetota bacterium]
MRRLLAVLLGAVACFAVLPVGTAAAHPLGNFTVNTADRLLVTQDGLVVTHVVDIAEIPTVQLGQARAGIDDDGDGTLSPAELTAYAGRECARVATLLSVVADGAQTPLLVTSFEGASRPGAAGLPTTRVSCAYDAGERPRRSVEFTDRAAVERNGWREVTAASECGRLTSTNVPTDSPTGLLTSYPEDLLQSPLDVSRARFEVTTGAACSSGAAAVTSDQVSPRGVDRVSSAFTDFLGRPDLTATFALLSFAAAVLFGVLHALAPGHGKTVMAAYLVGQRGTRRQALQLGAVVTFTHTASVLLLGAVLALGALAAPELVVPVTEVLSGLLLAAVGIYLAVLAVRRLAGEPRHEHGEHEHGEHEHGHDHHDYADHQEHPHRHGDEQTVPAPAEIGTVAVAARPRAHTHGGRSHTHAPLPDGPLSWKALTGMGVAGGLVPSPSALLVLLSATALGRAWFGVILVVAYGLGMAVTLTAAGLLLLRGRALLDRRGWSVGRGRNLVRLLPLGTAGIVVLVGLGLVIRGVLTGRGLL